MKVNSSMITRAERHPIRWSARIGHKYAGVTSGRVIDISYSGIRFLSRSSFNLGDMAEVEAYLDGRQDCRLVVSVTREQPAGEGWFCYGAEYQGMSPSSRHILLDAVNQIERKKSKGQYVLLR